MTDVAKLFLVSHIGKEQRDSDSNHWEAAILRSISSIIGDAWERKHLRRLCGKAGHRVHQSCVVLVCIPTHHHIRVD